MGRTIVCLCMVLALHSLAKGAQKYKAQNEACRTDKKLGDDTICVVLRKAPNGMEPFADPSPIRVDNRTSVKLVIRNVSPLESCSITKSSTATAEANPFQTLLTSVGGIAPFGLGGQNYKALGEKSHVLSANELNFSSANSNLNRIRDEILAKANENKLEIEKDPVFTSFSSAVTRVVSGVQKDLGKINLEQQHIDDGSRALLNYMADDYRVDRFARYAPHEGKDETKVSKCVAARYEKKEIAETEPAVCEGKELAIQDVYKLTQVQLRSLDILAVRLGDQDAAVGYAAYLHKKYELEDTPDHRTRFEQSIPTLQAVDKSLETVKAYVSMVSDAVTALKTSQQNLRTAFQTSIKLEDDYKNRKDSLKLIASEKLPILDDNGSLTIESKEVLVQTIALATDRKDTVSGSVTCTNLVDGKTTTTDPIPYSVLYQDIPAFSVSTGILVTNQDKYVLGIQDIVTSDEAGSKQVFGVKDSAPWQVFPMAFFSYRPLPFDWYWKWKYGRTREDRILVSGAITGGIGVNSNNGGNQPEFFVGPSITLNKVVISLGLHRGRMQSLGGGFTMGQQVPSDVKNAPINYAYHSAFSIGISYRIAPW